MVLCIKGWRQSFREEGYLGSPKGVQSCVVAIQDACVRNGHYCWFPGEGLVNQMPFQRVAGTVKGMLTWTMECYLRGNSKGKVE